MFELDYWRGLASSFHFRGKTLKDCMELIHEDVVDAWNFLDPKMLLARSDVKAMLWQVVEDMNDSTTDPNRILTLGITGVSTAAGIAGSLTGPAAPIAVPIAVGVAALGAWLYTVYQQTPSILRVLMAYIIDLTAILKGVFALLQVQSKALGIAKPREVTFDLIKLTVEAYNDSTEKGPCHKEIKDFIAINGNIFHIDHRDQVLEKVISLIKQFQFNPVGEFGPKAIELGKAEPDRAAARTSTPVA
ncbi:hypothetical protein FRB94_012434 [Tulasnella sp. JGI-2019a]|nr:hypothetical protein FRB93_003256 [Tulasnella sp. JGI-2019a]KAG8991559.1 hypothetical protein FRB94_012434 [Tulasnella sp. JGI-2019a]KAG9033172.1 hypothetical protein FRB95_000514 [Tulasnella sp. JGI-2019a]